MLFASVLFVVDGFLDGVYPGGPAWFTGKYDNLAEIAYLFAILNTVVAIMVARGSERSRQSRIGLSVFVLIERPVTAFALGAKPIESVITHFAAAGVELLIVVTALRVWRLGNAAPDVDTLFSLEGPSPTSAKPEQDADATRRGTGAVASRNAWLIGGVTVALALALVADGLYEGYVPGGRAWTTSSEGSGWIVYVFAAVALAVAARAIPGGGGRPPGPSRMPPTPFFSASFTPFSVPAHNP